MALARVYGRALRGMEAPVVEVEVHMANGLPQFTLVGLADTEVREARERVRSAILNCGFEFPHNQRITCSLAPADLPKVLMKMHFENAKNPARTLKIKREQEN
jgi:magnesium chelatase family protein